MNLSSIRNSLFVVSSLLASSLLAAPKDAIGDGPKVGDTISDFELRPVDSTEKLSLHSLKDRKAIVVWWNGVDCPISRLYAERLAKLSKQYDSDKIAFVGINSNRQDSVPKIRAFRREFGLRFPLCKDHESVALRELGTKRMTEVFVLDDKFKLRYHGAVDDQYTITNRSVGLRKDRPEQLYLVAAIDALLAGEDILKTETEAAGCIISRPKPSSSPSTITFHEHVEPIVQKRCQSCHRKGQIAPFELMTYEDVDGWAGMIREVVENRRMPPWHADPKYGHFDNDRSLSKKERETILAWVDQGSPQGDPKLAPKPLKFESEWQIGTPDVVFEMPRAFSVPASGTVRYKYFTIDTHFKEDKWVEAIEVRAGKREVVHHILVFCVDPKNRKRWRRETGGGVRGYFAAMVPGEQPAGFGAGKGKRLPAGAQFVFQVHYTTNGTEQEDRSKIGLRFAKGKVEHEVKTRSAYQTFFRIPARVSDHEVRAYYSFSEDAELLSLLPHMHLRGSAFRYEAHYPAKVKLSQGPWKGRFDASTVRRVRFDTKTSELTWFGTMSDENLAMLLKLYSDEADRKQLRELQKKSRSETLLSVPTYDFGWQSTYRLKKGKILPKGTLLEGIALFDNSAKNAALTRRMWNRSVRWGDQTWQEMMIGYFDYVAAE
ncbi:MAG: redoxin domain-containing protein [Planctomycetota bacterium]